MAPPVAPALHTPLTRRRFLAALAAGASSSLGARALGAQGEQGGAARQGASNMAMDQQAYRPVRLAPKPNATLSMSAADRDALEHRIHCQCGCNLDVFTCRTTDFACSVSPAMHADVKALVAGGYTADEIIDAFDHAYGERVLMAPKREGFNWLGYLLPSAAVATGAVAVAALIRRWGRPEAASDVVTELPVEATPEELARLEAAVRDERR